MRCEAAIESKAGRKDRANRAGDSEPRSLCGLRPGFAAEYLAEKHGIHAGRETVRKWMIEGKPWYARSQRVEKIHQWRPRRSRVGERVQWDTSEHAWLEDRGPKLYLIGMIDDASSRVHARFVPHDSTEENMRLPWSYVERYGWNKRLTVVPASSDDAHRPLGEEYLPAASLSYVESRQVSNDYTIQFDNKIWQIARSDIRAGLRGGVVRVEVRLDNSLAVRFGKRYLAVTQCQPRPKVPSPKVSQSGSPPRLGRRANG